MNEPESEKGEDFLARKNITDVEDFIITVTDSAGVTNHDQKLETTHTKSGSVGVQRPQFAFDEVTHRAHTIDVREYFLKTYRNRSTQETRYAPYADRSNREGRKFSRTIECRITYLEAEVPSQTSSSD